MSNAETLRAAIEEIWNEQDETAIDRYISEGYVGHTPDGDMTGRAAFRGLYATYRGAFPDCRVDVQQVVSEGDNVVAHFVFSGTHTGELLGIAPSGNSVSVNGMNITRWENGQVAEERAVWDSHALMQQVGAA